MRSGGQALPRRQKAIGPNGWPPTFRPVQRCFFGAPHLDKARYNSAMRLDYFLAHSAGVTRKQAKQLISHGAVTVDGLARPKAGDIIAGHTVRLDGEILQLPGERYLMLHKPPGVVCSTADPRHRSVLALLPRAEQHSLRIVGRLDIDTTGLLLLTTDGPWLHRITSPRSHCPKRYRATLAEPLDDTALQQLRDGVLLRDDPTPTRPALAERLAPNVLSLTITEGRYHQVKRMVAATGNRVLALHREAIGTVSLDPALAAGEFRQLDAQEIISLSTV